jgi:hypothetical protein
MKKYLPFFIIFLLISTIPALVFVLFPNAASNINSGDIPSFNQNDRKNSAGTEEVQTPDYLVRWRSRPARLKAGQPSHLTLNVLSRASGSPWEGQPTAALISRSKLASDSKPIPVSVKTAEQSGVYQVEIQFPHAGPWTLNLTLSPHQAPLAIPIYVPES